MENARAKRPLAARLPRHRGARYHHRMGTLMGRPRKPGGVLATLAAEIAAALVESDDLFRKHEMARYRLETLCNLRERIVPENPATSTTTQGEEQADT